jgi:SpoVK/Ycf46/Vps4 family AAA+-type ATPase
MKYLCPRNYRSLCTSKCKAKPMDAKEIDCSFLLYGPPGTGKTHLAKKIAEALQWPYLSITPSDFLAGGSAEVEQRAKTIFTMLEEQKNMVVLFDEIDHLLLDRESKEYSKLTGIFQFITPGMLPKLQELREKHQIIFIIATNYAERIDGAITREGRLDRRVVLLPHDGEGRERVIKKELKLKGKNSTELADAVKASRLMTYKELLSIAKDIDGQLTEKKKLFKFAEKARAKGANISTGSYFSRFLSESSNEKGKKKIKEFKKVPWKEFLSLIIIENKLEKESTTKANFENLVNSEKEYTRCFTGKDEAGSNALTQKEVTKKILCVLRGEECGNPQKV